jgi:predicted nucleic acid-binding protein
MVLVDTSVWVQHFREGSAALTDLLNNGEVAFHPFIIGELACGNLKNRTMILSLLESLPMSIVADHEEVLEFIERNKLMGTGLGYVDVHLMTSAILTGIPLWTLDKRLEQTAAMLHCKYQLKTI